MAALKATEAGIHLGEIDLTVRTPTRRQRSPWLPQGIMVATNVCADGPDNEHVISSICIGRTHCERSKDDGNDIMALTCVGRPHD